MKAAGVPGILAVRLCDVGLLDVGLLDINVE